MDRSFPPIFFSLPDYPLCLTETVKPFRSGSSLSTRLHSVPLPRKTLIPRHRSLSIGLFGKPLIPLPAEEPNFPSNPLIPPFFMFSFCFRSVKLSPCQCSKKLEHPLVRLSWRQIWRHPLQATIVASMTEAEWMCPFLYRPHVFLLPLSFDSSL